MRSKNRDALNAEIDKLREEIDRDMGQEFNAAGVPCGPIYSIDQMFEDAQVKYLGIAQDVPNTENRLLERAPHIFGRQRTLRHRAGLIDISALSGHLQKRAIAHIASLSTVGWLLGQRTVILLFAIVYHDRHPHPLVVFIFEEHSVGAAGATFRFRPA
jgi:hypothetical protein